MILEPRGLIAWLVVGLGAGWMAGQLIRGSRYRIVGDVVVGILGAVLGGALVGSLLPDTDVALLATIFAAIIGAFTLVALVRVLPGSSSL
jgi:uncharacterized membrane protein YeaQ/YmgE (transglycosylase-associated protein family)